MKTEPERSPLGEALAAVGDRWTLLLVEALLDGSRRFGELEAAVEGIAPNILTHVHKTSHRRIWRWSATFIYPSQAG